MAFHEESEMCEKGLRDQVQGYFRGQTKGIFFNVNAQRAYFNSKVYDPVWKNVEQNEEGKYVHRGKEFFDKPLPTLSNTLRAKMLYENVGNPFHCRLDECRKLGGMGCITMRMNDCHLSGYPESPMHSDFWYDHRDYRLNIWRSENGSGLNYAIKEVRQYAMKFIREVFEIFDLDAFELDWMRTPPYFTDGHEEENRSFLTEIVAFTAEEKKKAEKKWGHRILLTTRVPSRVEEALLLGLDIIEWVKKKYVEMVVPCAFIGSADGEMPIAVWRQILGDEVKLVPGIDILTNSHEEGKALHNVAEFVYGYAANFFHQGAEDIYLFNHMDRLTGLRDKESYRKLLQCAGEKETVEKCFRRHVATMVQNCVPGVSYASNLPRRVPEFWNLIRIGIGGSVKGRKAKCLLAFDSREELKKEDFEFEVNEVICQEITKGSPLPVGDDENWQKFTAEIPLGTLRDGSCVLGVRALRKLEAKLEWCEIDIEEEK